MGRIAALALLLWILAADGAGQSPQPPTQTFRSAVDLVQVDVTVLDRDRMPIHDLTAADFTILEDGKARPIAAFTPVQLPPRDPEPTAQWMADIRSDVVTNDLPQEGRLIVIVMDRSIRSGEMPVARRIATAAIEQFGPDDLGAVAYSQWGTPQNFTADRQRLLAAIRQPYIGMTPGNETSPAECRCGICTFEVMTRVADALRDVPQRRKMLLFVGRTLPIQSMGECGGMLREARNKLLRAAQVANLTIHVLDPSGLEAFSLDASQRGPGGTSAVARNMMRQGNLMFFPDATGGRTVINNNAPEDRILPIFRESSSYYILGFEPASRKTDGAFHDIRIKVNRPDIVVQARKGYYAPGGKARPVLAGAAGAPASLIDAVASLWPHRAVPLSVSVAPFAGADLNSASAVIVVHVRQDEAGVLGNVNVLAGAFDQFGRSVSFQRQTVSVSPPLNNRGEFEYEVQSRLAMKPGRYEVRVALEDASQARTGSVYTYVDVPNFGKEALSLSGVVVDARPAMASAPAAASDLLAVVPRTRRAFARSDEVTVLVRAYQGKLRGLSPVTMSARIVDDTNRIVYQQTTVMQPGEFGADRAADYLLDMPLGRLTPGEHLLTIDAMAGLSQVRRTLRFTVK